MKKYNLKRFLASLLAVLMLASVTGVSPAVFADFGESSRSGIATYAKKEIVLKGDCSVRLPYNEDGTINYDTLEQLVFNECVNVSASNPNNLTLSDVSITHNLLPLNIAGIEEGKTYKILFTYKVIYTASCNVTFLGREPVPEIANKNITVDASFNEDLSIDYGALRKAIWEQVSVGLPTNVKFEDVSFTYKFKYGIDYWPTFEGNLEIGSLDIPIPTLGLGENTVKLTWGGDKEYKSWEQKITVNVVDGRTDTSITFVEDRTVNIPFTETGIDYEAVKESIWALIDTITPADISKDSITVKYEGTDINDNPAISEGNHTLNFSYAGSANYKPFSTDVPVNFIDNRIVAFAAKERPDNLSRGYVGNTLDEAKTLEKAREELVTALKDVPLSEIKVEYKLAGNYIPLDINGIRLNLTEINKTDIRVSYAGNATYKAFSKEFKDLYFADNRVASSIAIKEGASITFNMSADNMKQQIFDNVIDWDSENTKLPAKGTLTIADFKFEIGSKDIADKDGYPNLDAGNGQTIKISFVGNSEFKPCNDVKATIDVAKADVKVTMKSFSTAHAGNADELTQEALGVALDPNDPKLDVYMIFAGINTNLDSSVNLVLTKDQQAVVDKISNAQKDIFDLATKFFPDLDIDKTTLKDKLESGITIGQFKEYLNSFIAVIDKIPGADEILNRFGVSIDTIKTMATIFDKLTQFSDDTVIAVGAPKHAGLYTATAVAVNKNYNTGYTSGVVMILMNAKGMKLEPNESVYKKTLTVSEAEAIVANKTPVVTLTYNGSAENIDQSSVHYLYTGVTKPFGLYSSKEFPTKPGSYIVTASVIGGDYLAPPKTFTFKIVAD